MGKLWYFGRLRWSLTREVVANGGSTVFFLACVASVSVWFRNKERPRNGIFRFSRARNGTRAKKNEREGGGGEGTFPPHLLPALLLAPFFARSSTLVPRSLLRNRTEKLASRLYFFRCHYYCPTCSSSRPPYIFLSKFQVGLVMQGLGLKKKGGLILR